VQPPAIPVGPGSNSTWTSTLLAGEALVGLQSGTSADIPMVTQELELVYWKEIKESMDIEDIQGFLARFPSGIYADLARRRLKKMGVPGGEDSDIGRRLGTGTLIVPRPAGQDTAGATNPGATNPGVTNSGITNPGITNPGITRPAVTNPGVSSPGATNPGVTNPGTATDLAWKALEEAAAQAPVVPPPPSLPAAPAADDPDATRMGAPAMAVQPVPAVPQPQSEPSEWPETVFSDAGPVTVQFEAAEAKAKAEAAPAAAAASAATAVPEARPESSRKRRSAEPGTPAKASAASPPPYLVWGGIALVALVIMGVGVRQLSKPKAPALAAAQPAAAAADDGPARPAAAPAAPQPAVQAAQAQPAAAAAPAAAASTAAVAAPLSPASKAAAAQAIAAKKAALEKERLSKQQAAQAKSGGSTSTPAAAAAEHAPAPAPSANAGNPRQACEDRMLIGFQICMNEQCAKPAFTNHPVCVERRAMEQRRREAEQLRR